WHRVRQRLSCHRARAAYARETPYWRLAVPGFSSFLHLRWNDALGAEMVPDLKEHLFSVHTVVEAEATCLSHVGNDIEAGLEDEVAIGPRHHLSIAQRF